MSLDGYTDHADLENSVPFGGPPFCTTKKGGPHRYPMGPRPHRSSPFCTTKKGGPHRHPMGPRPHRGSPFCTKKKGGPHRHPMGPRPHRGSPFCTTKKVGLRPTEVIMGVGEHGVSVRPTEVTMGVEEHEISASAVNASRSQPVDDLVFFNTPPDTAEDEVMVTLSHTQRHH
ncbi:hypothetical protein BO79DRAFT_254571 [Aspergillus costaricaensis CBS 115574]|uniref:Uncharacterized protein n=1 Tax=Aspergillus costaricaensis CBS 115574 TaxID=1448317 RepID=A0ACD1IFV7_9EURO|nr:hypothetical protein BO79DRAFT_254571 [Aspergillus costaricaensis CBS 115574]RAK89173.1 hypothetical protein BO79DRAFT_254571 [Aspergillus costaricaensis CBS 115574]